MIRDIIFWQLSFHASCGRAILCWIVVESRFCGDIVAVFFNLEILASGQWCFNSQTLG